MFFLRIYRTYSLKGLLQIKLEAPQIKRSSTFKFYTFKKARMFITLDFVVYSAPYH
ncbi:hypothetical protein P3J6_120316 [Pseudoalteromonas sp. 3J6]|nr:hypothetical protein P3J6_120316 [Pseudoalteromonas sp. 3J6]